MYKQEIMRVIFVLATLFFSQWQCRFEYFISKLFCRCKQPERLLATDLIILKRLRLRLSVSVSLYIKDNLKWFLPLQSPSPGFCYDFCRSCTKLTTQPRGLAVSRYGSAYPPGYLHHVPEINDYIMRYNCQYG